MADAHPDPSWQDLVCRALFSSSDAVVLAVSAGGHCGRWVDPHRFWHFDNDPVTPRVHCHSTAPGHNVHQIQGRLGLQSPSRLFALVDVVDQFVLVRDLAGVRHRWWLHDTDAVLAAVLLDQPALHLHEHGLARIGHTLFYPHVDETTPPKPCWLRGDDTP